MKFGKTIRLEQALEWNSKHVDYYVDYKELKQLLKKHLASAGTNDGTLAFLALCRARLAREVKKVDGFLKRQTTSLCARVDGGDGDSGASFDADRGLAWSIALNKLRKFAEVNHMGLCKFIKKLWRHFGGGPSPAAEVLLEDHLEEGEVAGKGDGAESAQGVLEVREVLEALGAKVAKMRARHVALLEALEAKLDAQFQAHSFVLPEYDEESAEEKLSGIELDQDVPVVRELLLESLPPGSITRVKLAIVPDELGENTVVHVLVAKGKYAGPVLGITSALHGNELNGIPLIFRLFREVDVDTLRGTLVAVPVLNPPGYQRRQRAFHDGQDLNRLFPGKADGNCGQTFAHHVLHKIVRHLDYHIDMHTASFGRKNSLYVRADMLHPVSHHMAQLQEAQIIVHNTAPDGSLRSAAMAMDIPSITVEIGDPLVFHNSFVVSALCGVERVMGWLEMQKFDDIDDAALPAGISPAGAPPEASAGSDSHASLQQEAQQQAQQQKETGGGDEAGSSTATAAAAQQPRASPKSASSVPAAADTDVSPVGSATTICARSKWIFSPHGGVMRVRPAVNTWVQKGQAIAIVQNLFGDVTYTLRAPADAIVVGKSTNPICAAGDRLVHLGYVEDEFPSGPIHDGHT